MDHPSIVTTASPASPLRPFLPIEAPQSHLHLRKLLLGLLDRGLAVLQADVVVQLVFDARCILVRAEVLDLLAAVLDLGKTEGGGGAFEEVAEGGELL